MNWKKLDHVARVEGRPWWKIIGVKTAKLASGHRVRFFYIGSWARAWIEIPSHE